MAWWDRAKIGQLIVAIRDGRSSRASAPVVKGRVYTIRRIYTGPQYTFPIFSLEEIFSTLRDEDGNEFGGWGAKGFRPAELPKSITSLLNTAPSPELIKEPAQ